MKKTCTWTASEVKSGSIVSVSGKQHVFCRRGGYLVHAVIWHSNATYGHICQSYVSDTVVVFAGYNSKNSTKKC